MRKASRDTTSAPLPAASAAAGFFSASAAAFFFVSGFFSTTASGSGAGACRLVLCRAIRLDVEFEFEIDGRIIETAHGGEGDLEFFRHVGEGQTDLEAGVGHFQVPVLELDDDGHLLGIALAQSRRHAHARRAGEERDEEMMVAGKAGARDFGQDLAHDAAQRLLGQNVVADVVVGHVAVRFR